MAVDFKHKEYEDNVDKWEEIDAICEGEDVNDYLVELSAHDRSPENRGRNKAYKKRAVFYQIAGRTAQGLNSLLFSEKPKLSVPAQLDYLKTNADGKGNSIFQQSRDVALDIIKMARGGLFVSYPKTHGELSKQDMATGNFFATFNEYEADQIINWREITVGSKVMLGLVVLSESVEEVQEDGFETKEIEQMRELSLVNKVFIESLWRKDKHDEWQLYSKSIPVDGKGNTWDIIPFSFIGADSNTSEVGDSIMRPLVKLNIGHYRNSAELENSVWYLGHPQAWMSGLSQTHIDLMQANNMQIGSPKLLGVPSGERFGIESAQPNTMVRQAMIDKVDAMIGLGARYIQPSGVAKTATESNNDTSVQHSALALISANVSEAYTQCIEWAARYMNVTLVNEDGYLMNDDFFAPTATAQEIQAMVAGYIQGAIPVSDYFAWLQKMDISSKEKTLEEFTSEIDKVSMPNLGAP